MHLPTPLRLATFAASILLRAVLVNHVAAWLQTQGVENTIRAVFMRPSADAPRTACSASSVGAGTSTNSGVPSVPRRYTPFSTRQCR